MTLTDRGSAESWPHIPGYALHGLLGSGGMGIVYRATALDSGQDVALKVLKHVHPSAIYRFKQEFRALADIAHPNLVVLHELSYAEPTWFFTMELVDGVSWTQYLNLEDKQQTTIQGSTPERSSGVTLTLRAGVDRELFVPSEARLRDLLLQLGLALSAIHGAGKLHRDVKPSNVLIERSGRLVLLDYGLIADVHDDEASRGSASIVGTVEYMSPEQSLGRALGPASDLYALGVMLYEALCGITPFAAGSHLLQMKRSAVPAPPESVRADVSPALARLCMELLALDPARRPSLRDVLARVRTTASAATDAGGRTRPTRVQDDAVGRAAELAQLHKVAAEVRAGQSRVVVLSGPSGIGKTCLLNGFVRSLESSGGCWVLRGRCHERESVPYKAFDTIIDALSMELERRPRGELEASLPDTLCSLARMFPVLRRIRPVEARLREEQTTDDPQQQRREAWHALRQLVSRLAGGRQVVVAVDDLQWGDLESALLLENLLVGPEAPTVLLLGSARDEEIALSPMLSVLLAPDSPLSDSIVELPLAALQEADAEEVARALLGPHAEPALIRAIAAESRGIPFFIDELAHFVDTRSLDINEPSALRRGLELDSVLRERISDLSSSAQRTLGLVAAAGRAVVKRVVEHAADSPHAGVWLELGNARLLRVSTNERESSVECYHDRVRESALGMLPPETLAAYHGALAHSFDAMRCGESEEVLEHYTAAGQAARAVVHAARAADAAFGALAFARAARLYRVAFELSSPDGLRSQGLLLKLAHALANAGHVGEAAAYYAQAAARSTGSDAIQLSRKAAQHYLTAGDQERGREHLRAALRAVGLPYPETRGAAALRLIGERLRLRMLGLRYRERPVSALSDWERERLDTCYSAAAGFSMNDLLRNAAFAAWHLRLALASGEPSRIARGLALEIGIVPAAGREGARWARRHAIPLAQHLQRASPDPYRTALLALGQGQCAYLTGDWTGTHELLQRCDELFAEVKTADVYWARSSARVSLCASLAMVGDIHALSTRLPSFVKEAQERSDQHALALLAFPRVLLELAADRVEQAQLIAEEAAIRRPGQSYQFRDLTALHCTLLIDRYRGEHARSWDRLEAVWPELVSSDLLQINILRVLMLIERADAGLASAPGFKRRHPSHAQAARCVRALRREPLPFTNSCAAALEARFKHMAGESGEASSLLRDASSGFGAAQMPLHAACCTHEAARISGDASTRTRAREWLTARGIRQPARFVQLLAPGFDAR